MLWSREILSAPGPLHDAWLAAARHGGGLTRARVEAVNLQGACICEERPRPRGAPRARLRPAPTSALVGRAPNRLAEGADALLELIEGAGEAGGAGLRVRARA
jgi:hypothetical protein